MTKIDPALYGFIGSLIGGGLVLFSQWLTRRQEDRSHIRELGLKMGLARHENCVRAAQQEADATKKIVTTPPFEACIVDGVKLMEVVSTPGLSAEEMARRIAEYRAYSQSVLDSIQKKK
jgi:hypothetical protein